MGGEGSVFRRRSDGRWVAVLSVGPRGAAKKLVRYAPRRDNTQRAAKELLTRLIGDAEGPTSTMTVGEYLRRFLDDYDVGRSQRANAASLLRTWIEPAIGGIPLAGLRPDDIRVALRILRTRRSAQLARHAYNLLAVALDRAEHDELIPRNPVRRVERPSVKRADKRPWTRDQLDAFLHAAEGDRYHALYLAAAATGLRQGELLGLAWSDVDLDGGRITVAVQLQRVNGAYKRVPPKGDRPPRVIEVPGIVIDALRDHRASQLEERIEAGVPTEDGLVFLTEAGRPVNASVITHRLQRIAAKAGLPRQDFHSFRRYHGTLAAALGIHPSVEQAALGHASSATTLAHYTYTTDAEARIAADLIDKAFRRVG
jgi:integrase